MTAPSPTSATNVRSRWFLVGALIVMTTAVIIATVRDTEPNDPASRALRIERQIACPVCDGESIAESNAAESVSRRRIVARKVAEGQSDEEILAYFASTNGRLMLNPSEDGIGLVAWGIPVVAFVLGATGLAFAIRKWRREPRMVATQEDTTLVERARRDLDRAVSSGDQP